MRRDTKKLAIQAIKEGKLKEYANEGREAIKTYLENGKEKNGTLAFAVYIPGDPEYLSIIGTAYKDGFYCLDFGYYPDIRFKEAEDLIAYPFFEGRNIYELFDDDSVFAGAKYYHRGIS